MSDLTVSDIRNIIAELPIMRSLPIHDLYECQKTYFFKDVDHINRAKGSIKFHPQNRISFLHGDGCEELDFMTRQMLVDKKRASELVSRQIIVVNIEVERNFIVKCMNFFNTQHRKQVFFISPVYLAKRHNFLSDNIEKILDVVNYLEDEESVICYLSRVKALMFGDAGYIRMSNYRQYRHPVVRAAKGETVVDAGIGPNINTSLSFKDLTGHGSAIFAFEPAQSNLIHIRDEAKKHPEIQLIEKGLSDKEETVEFTMEGPVSTSLSRRSAYKGQTETAFMTSLDAFFSKDIGPVHLIKMDIEGAEQKALKGAVKTISCFKPKLQVCLYHSDSDFLEIPLIVKKLNPSYRLWIGHHTPYGNECILYAN